MIGRTGIISGWLAIRRSIADSAYACSPGAAAAA